MIIDPFPPFRATHFRIKQADDAWEHRGAAALRRLVFCEEQKIFRDDDRDAIDDVAITLIAFDYVGVAPGDVIGTVRIHEAEPGVWWGSRLAVAPAYRRVGALGTALIRLAVGTAHGRGCTRFHAHVQAQNGPLFARLNWHTRGELSLHGHPHLHMEADLDHYPPMLDAAAVAGWQATARIAA